MRWPRFRRHAAHAPAPPKAPPHPPPLLVASPLAASAVVLGSLPLLLFVVILVLECLLFRPLRSPAKRSKSLGQARFAAAKLPDKVDAIVIGSGQGGLSCASVLAQFGKKVVVLEQHEVTGGGAHCFAVDGKSKWRFDAGHHITIPWHEQVQHLACGTAHTPVPFIFTANTTTDGFSDHIALGEAPEGEVPLPIRDDVQLTNELIKRFPQHEANIHRYMSVAESVQMRFGLLTAASILPMPMRTMLLRSPLLRMWREWAGKTATEGLCTIFPGTDEATCRLRSYISGLWIDAGAPPSRCSFFMQTAVMGGWQKLGVSYPTGGPQQLALAMVEAIEQRGGSVFVRAPVASVLIDAISGAACGVRLTSGDEVRASTVVSAIGYRATEGLLPHPPSPLPIRTAQSAGFVMANIALRGTMKELGISAGNTWVQPANRANNYDALEGEKAFFADPLQCERSLVPVGITFPSAKEASAAEDVVTEHTCQILTLGEYDWFDHHSPVDAPALAKAGARHAPPHVARRDQATYDAAKKTWAERLEAILYETYPGTKGRVVFTDISTPLTLETYLRAEKGAGVGLDATPERFTSPSELAELDMKHPRVPNFWRCGQDYLMYGQIISAASGIVCALRMLGPLATARYVCRALRLLLLWGSKKKSAEPSSKKGA